MQKKVLIVEDNPELSELLRLNFEEAGFSTGTASNGRDALTQARAFSPDLVLLDLMLPELDGFAVCEILRGDPAMAGVRIVMLTGVSGQLTRYAGLESGADDYVTKPINPEQLVAKVRKLLCRSPEGERFISSK